MIEAKLTSKSQTNNKIPATRMRANNDYTFLKLIRERTANSPPLYEQKQVPQYTHSKQLREGKIIN